MRRIFRTDTAHRTSERYDHPAKGAVRAHLVPFFTDRVPPVAVERATVWFFPGTHPAEFDGYRQLGIPTMQLRGFEWNPTAADAIAAYAPSLPLYRGSLGDFLTDPHHASERCDWANLDFDGAALTFREEVAAVVSRMRTDAAPRLAITSFASRDRTTLRESVIAASALHAIVPEHFRLGADLVAVGNEYMGLAMHHEQAWFASAREFAVSLMLLRAFGGRSYGPDDDAAAAEFRASFDRAFAVVHRSTRGDAIASLTGRRGLPVIEAPELRTAVARRAIPLWVEDSLRFAYRSASHNWMWTWMLRLAPTNGRPVGLLEWATRLLTTVPPLHVIDRTGWPIRANVCRWCPREADTGTPPAT